MGRALVNKTMKSGGKMKKAQNGVTTKKGRTTINVTDTSGYAAGKKAGYPAQMISPKTKYSKGDTTNVTVNRNTISKAIGEKKQGEKGMSENEKVAKGITRLAPFKKTVTKNKTGGMTKKCKYGCK